MTESIEEIMKEIMDIIFKRWEVFKQLEMASKSENIETVREKKVTLDNLAETFQLFNNAFDYFYDIKKAEHWRTDAFELRCWRRWLDGIMDPMDMSMSKMCEIVKGRQSWCAAVHGVTKSQTRLRNWKTTK